MIGLTFSVKFVTPIDEDPANVLRLPKADLPLNPFPPLLPLGETPLPFLPLPPLPLPSDPLPLASQVIR